MGNLGYIPRPVAVDDDSLFKKKKKTDNILPTVTGLLGHTVCLSLLFVVSTQTSSSPSSVRRSTGTSAARTPVATRRKGTLCLFGRSNGVAFGENECAMHCSAVFSLFQRPDQRGFHPVVIYMTVIGAFH